MVPGRIGVTWWFSIYPQPRNTWRDSSTRGDVAWMVKKEYLVDSIDDETPKDGHRLCSFSLNMKHWPMTSCDGERAWCVQAVQRVREHGTKNRTRHDMTERDKTSRQQQGQKTSIFAAISLFCEWRWRFKLSQLRLSMTSCHKSGHMG